jgi:hypothetical protein
MSAPAVIGFAGRGRGQRRLDRGAGQAWPDRADLARGEPAGPEQVAGQVLAEPDTPVFVPHLVPNAPLQRIRSEASRDRAAFGGYGRQPNVTRFAPDRRPRVLAADIIELRLTYATVAPRPGPGPGGYAQRRCGGR